MSFSKVQEHRVMNTNGCMHDGADFWVVEIDLLLGKADVRPLDIVAHLT